MLGRLGGRKLVKQFATARQTSTSAIAETGRGGAIVGGRREKESDCVMNHEVTV